MKSKWSDLSEDLILSIEECVVLYVDKVRFRAVCESWNSVLPKMPNSQDKKIPWLLDSANVEEKGNIYGLLSPVDKGNYLLDLPQDYSSFCGGSYNNWVLSYDGIAYLFRYRYGYKNKFFLMNLLDGSRIKLPARNKLPTDERDSFLDIDDDPSSKIHTVRKFVCSSDPLENDCMVFVIYDKRRLAYCKINEDKWTAVPNVEYDIRDILYHKGKLHLLSSSGELYVLENIITSEFTHIASLENGILGELFLAESPDGGIVMVEQKESYTSLFSLSASTYCHQVYKPDRINLKWSLVTNIGDQIIFVDKDSATVVSCVDFPGLEGNNIYFLQNVSRAIHFASSIRASNLNDQTIEPLPVFDEDRWHVKPLCVRLNC